MKKPHHPLHVGLVTTSYPLGSGSVSGIFVKRLVENLPQDLRVTVIAPGGTRPPEAASDGGQVLIAFRYAPLSWQVLAHGPGGVPAALKRNPSLYLMLPVFLLSMLAACIRVARQADLLHANWTLSGAVAGLAGRVTNTPLVTTLRGQDVARTEHSVLDRMLLRLTLRWSSQVVVVADGLAQAVGRRIAGGTKKVTLIPNGVDDVFLAIGDRNRPFGGDLRLVFVGSLLANKAVDCVLRALAKSNETGPASLVVAGDGPERQRLEALAGELDLQAAVHFAGMVPADEVPALLGRADALVLASYQEGRPNVVLEAMAARLPVIASDIPGTTELVSQNETGLLFRPGDVEGLAAQIVKLRDDPALRSRLGEAGRAFVVENELSWQATGRRYAQLYRRVLDGA